MADTNLETTGATQSTLSEWAGPYVTDMLGRAEAYAKMPFETYSGALTAGPSELQTKAFQGIGNLTLPSQFGTASTMAQDIYSKSKEYMPTVGTVESYMNPYLEAVLDPQRREAQRQADLSRRQMQSRMAQAGAYGGSRQAIMEAEGQRNLQTLLGDITGKGYSSAWEQAQKQRMDDIRAGQQGLGYQTQAAQTLSNIGGQQAQYGLQNLQEMLKAGETQRGIEQQGLTADYNQYLRELEYPQKMLEFQKSMLSGLPISTYSTQGQAPSDFSTFAGGSATVLTLLKELGILPKD